MKKPLIIFLIILFVLLLCSCVAVATLAGKAPGLSSIFWKQKDLGVTADTQLIKDFYTEIGFENNISEGSNGTPTYSGEIYVSEALSTEEANAWVNLWAEQWTDMPFENPQLVIHENGSMEGSAMLSVSKAIEFAKQLGYSDEEIEKAKSSVSIINDQIPVYVMADGEIIDNQISLNLTKLEVAGFNAPENIRSGFEDILADIFPKVQSMAPSLDIEKLQPTSEGITFVGTIPQEVTLE